MFKEFKEFAMRGNVLDLAIGVIIGGAFGKIVSSFVNDVLMPPIGKLMGDVDFSNLFQVLGTGNFDSLKAAKDAGAATLNYGLFINAVIDFLIVAFSIFLVVKAVNRAMPKPAPAPAPPMTEWGSPPRARIGVLSPNPGDWSNQGAERWASAGNSVTVRFYVAAFVSGSVYPVLAPNTTYYFNIKSANPADNPGAADMFVDASFG